jgi:hypothetical protein
LSWWEDSWVWACPPPWEDFGTLPQLVDFLDAYQACADVLLGVGTVPRVFGHGELLEGAAGAGFLASGTSLGKQKTPAKALGWRRSPNHSVYHLSRVRASCPWAYRQTCGCAPVPATFKVGRCNEVQGLHALQGMLDGMHTQRRV